MFQRATVTVIFVMCSFCVFSARTYAQEGDVLVVQKGQTKSISLDRLSGASVQDVNVSYIESKKGDEVVIVGAGPGETTLTLTQRGGQQKTFRVRVVTDAAEQHSPSTAHPGAGAPPRPTPTPAQGTVEGGGQTDVIDARSPSAPEPPPAPQAPSGSATARRRLQLSLEATYISDTEQFPLLSVGAPHQHESGDHGDHSHDGHEGSPHLHQDGTVTARRSLLVFPLSLRYSLNHRDAVTFVAPFIRRRDTIEFAGNSAHFGNEGLGDIQVGFERIVPGFLEAWDANWGISVRVPTGESVYDIEEGESPLGTGHYEVGGGFGVRRIFDPVVFRAGVNVNYTLPRKSEGVWFKPGLGHSVNTGIDYALTDRLALSEQLFYTQRQNAFLVNPTDARTETLRQTYLAHSLYYKPKRGRHAYRFTFTLGLNNSAADYATGLTFTR
ncbi:MAG: pilus assembly protein N-terminal domain-containing protein [Acidobacteriota bacterium]|nr:pilus assembly protein N-terminal domain-containing protein [Acidobacteriota bacterium]